MDQDTPAPAYLWLDVNTSGAWKHVLRFQAVNAPEVRDLAAALAAMAATQRYEWRSA